MTDGVSNLRYHNITTSDMLNGDGLRVVLWVSGCEHHCPGCQNPQTWAIDSGIPFDTHARSELFYLLSQDYISGITFSGGDPLHTQNRDHIGELIRKIKLLLPNKTIWIYTGFLWEEIRDFSFMPDVDVVVDGPYIEKIRNVQLHWVGSANQRVINVKKSLELGTVVLLEE